VAGKWKSLDSMIKILFIGLLLVLLIPGSTICTNFKPDPVYEHIKKYGTGVDMSKVPADKQIPFYLKPKGW